MSLSDIRMMRMARHKPSGVVSVVIGTVPKAYREDPLMVEIAPGSNPILMDWRPLVGVWVQVLHLTGGWGITDQVIEAIDKAGGKLFGFARAGCFHPLALFDDPEDSRRAAVLMQNEWESICS